MLCCCSLDFFPLAVLHDWSFLLENFLPCCFFCFRPFFLSFSRPVFSTKMIISISVPFGSTSFRRFFGRPGQVKLRGSSWTHSPKARHTSTARFGQVLSDAEERPTKPMGEPMLPCEENMLASTLVAMASNLVKHRRTAIRCEWITSTSIGLA